MKKRALRKDFYMEIRKSLGRFLSIFFIVAIGTAFFSGIRSAEPDMRLTGDAYSDNQNLMDIQVISTLGLTEKDWKALEEVEGIERVEGGYSADVLCESRDSRNVLHVISLLPTLNQVVVEEGRLPEAADECFVDMDFLAESDYRVGDQVTFLSGTDQEITDTFRTDTFTIVGSGSSPCYISFYRGSSTIGNGSVSGFVYVPEQSFDMEVYTELYATVKGAKELTVFTDAYDEQVEAVTDRVEAIKEERQLARYQEIVEEANEELDKAKAELADAKAEAEEKLRDAQEELDDGRRQLEDGKSQLVSGRRELENGKSELSTQQALLDEKRSELDRAKEELAVNQETLNQGRAQWEDGQAQLAQEWEKWNAASAALTAGLEEIEVQLAKMQQDYENLLASGAADPAVLEQLQGGIAQLEAQRAQLQGQQEALEQGKMVLEQNQARLDEEGRKIEESQQALNEAAATVEEGGMQLDDGQNQINAGWEEITANESTLNAAAAEISANEKKLLDGQAEYEKAKAEADEKIAEGEQKIQDAEDEVQKIEHAKWYINDRSVLTEYAGYGENADRMRAIGQVFPVLFFLVAALISLTTMTRMVEEQRVQIGTLKALGYSRGAIAAKYLGYAFLATITGSVIGVLIGEKLLPYIIIVAYGIMYGHVNTLQIPYETHYAVMATVAAIFCTVGAAWFACYKELRGTAAELMRPPAPKSGKRVFLERIPLFWKRLSFIWKATVRNLIRYKKRFFMTVFGISGCMALLLVGYGLEDSISNIARLQYGEIQSYDANLILNDSAEVSERDEAVEALRSDERVKESERTMLEQMKVNHGKVQKEIYLAVPEDAEQYKHFVTFQDRVTKERHELSENGVILTEKIASLLEVEEGDVLTIRDDIQGEIEVTIEAICENYISHYMYMTPTLYEQLFQRTPEYNAVCFQMQDAKRDKLEEVGEQILTYEGALSISYMSEVQDQVDTMLTSLDSVLVVLVLSAGMLAFVVLYNLNNINITERRRELATLKVLGFYDGEVSAYVYRENVVLTLIGAALGCLLGKVLHQFVILTVEIDTVMFGRNIDLSSFVYSVLITIGFSCFVNWVMYFKLKKIDMVESLKSVE